MSSSGSGDEVDAECPIIRIDVNSAKNNGTDTESSGYRSDVKFTGDGFSCTTETPAAQDADLSEEIISPNSGKHSSLIYEEENFGFNLLFLRRFFNLHGLLFLSFTSLSTLLFIFLLALSLLEEYIGYHVGLVASKFYKVLGQKDLNGFWRETGIAIGIILAISFIKSTKQYMSKVLTVTWRELLSKAAHRLYFSDSHYYQLNVLDKVIDNPDQRITQDTDKFCSSYCEVLPKLIISPFVIAYYTHESFTRSGWHGPVACFIYFILATVLNKLLMSPIVRLVVKQEKCEGNFRFIHLLVRVNSESIAFHKAANLEAKKANESLDDLISVQQNLYCKQYVLNFVVNLSSYAGSILSYLVLAVPIFSGSYDNLTPAELGALISENAFVNIYLIYCFTSLMQLSSQLTDVAGVSHRIAQLLERINALNEFWKDVFPNDDDSLDDLDEYSKWLKLRNSKDVFRKPDGGGDGDLPKLPAWTIENISFSAPFQKDPLMTDLSMEIKVGESILIIGDSSAGKSSLLRVLRGLWPLSEGTIKRHLPPGPQGVFYCPQKPYLTVGTLREQICFPLRLSLKTANENEHLIIHYLKLLNLMPLMERIGGLDNHVSWNVYDSLSPGEMQRLSFLRIFYHRPMVAVLDEATSALPAEMEDTVYSECQRLRITTLSVGHRMSLRQFHDKVLTINPKGRWTLNVIN